MAARMLALPHWFNPLAWWAVRRYDEAAEWACDLAATGETSTTMYARALVRLGETAGSHASYSPAARGRPSMSCTFRQEFAVSSFNGDFRRSKNV